MDNSGRIFFGVYPGSVQTLSSSAGFNDGQWHQVTASLGANGMRLYLDGKLVGSRTDVTSGQAYTGYWRIGGDNIGGWTNQPASNFFAGSIGQVSLYPTVLDRSTVVNKWIASGRPSPLAPAESIGISTGAEFAPSRNSPFTNDRYLSVSGTTTISAATSLACIARRASEGTMSLNVTLAWPRSYSFFSASTTL